MQKGSLSDKIGTFRGRGDSLARLGSVSHPDTRCCSQDTRPNIRGTSAGVVNDIRFLYFRRGMAPKKLRIISFFWERLYLLFSKIEMLTELPTNVKVNRSFIISIARVLFKLYVCENDVESSWKPIKNFDSWRWGAWNLKKKEIQHALQFLKIEN